MKGLTVRQPWATLLACGMKRWETRRWRTHYRGLLAIHAGVQADDHAMSHPLIVRALDAIRWPPDTLPTGCVVGICSLAECVRTPVDRHVFDLELVIGNHAEGRYAWRIANPVAITPVQASGAQGLWQVAPPLAGAIVRRVHEEFGLMEVST